MHDHFKRPNPTEFGKLLRVDKHVEQVFTHKISGGLARKLDISLVDRFKCTKPHFVVLEYGSNELARKEKPRNIANDILELAVKLKQQHKFDLIILCSVLYRTGVDNDRVHELNNFLYNGAKNYSFIRFHAHSKLVNNSPQKFSKDGIHVNRIESRELYIKSIRRAIFNAVELLYKITVSNSST